ncbi:hypothetical protein MATL_G00126510 [Megalops atlanticus]|uniref:Uncharacterized protein n=1 Tax=Megalops atlanticus TaxID=7932 RepID=A0A9D3PZW3_MEGAT|nr:hypothetical protein MATL_G00126510 [Megalops atlanticus]
MGITYSQKQLPRYPKAAEGRHSSDLCCDAVLTLSALERALKDSAAPSQEDELTAAGRREAGRQFESKEVAVGHFENVSPLIAKMDS